MALFTSPNITAQQHAWMPVVFFGDTIQLPSISPIKKHAGTPINSAAVRFFYEELNQQNNSSTIYSLLQYKQEKKLDDWLYYQLIRRTAQQLSPKELDYDQYTLYKWYLLQKSGYNAQLAFANEKLLFYVQSDDNIYDIPLFEKEGKQYVCLNIHDFGPIDFSLVPLTKVEIDGLGLEGKSFSYKVTQIPDFTVTHYQEKELVFNYQKKEYRYNIKVDPFMQKMFNNYPSVDFEAYFNIPLSKVTYSSLIPALKKKLKGMRQQKGVEYLMQFTRYAFMYEDDQLHFGKEKRLSPEQTLINDYSDCDDRVGLFYFLVKELYNLPMIVLIYPSHVTLAIELKNSVGVPVLYNGRKFSVCEPTPQKLDLPIGALMPQFINAHYDVAYEYLPKR
ncbi:MAG: hypothetical protein WEA59_05690 [Ferruginibacter sp.]